MNINREELAWAAGLFDGEGWVGTTTSKADSYLRITLSVPQKNREVLDRFQNAVHLGRINGPYASSHSRSSHYRFSVSNFEETQAIIAMLYQFLSPVKQQQCKIALIEYGEWYKTVRHYQARRSIQ